MTVIFSDKQREKYTLTEIYDVKKGLNLRTAGRENWVDLPKVDEMIMTVPMGKDAATG